MKKEGEKYYRKAKQELTLKQRRKYQEDYKMTTWIINFYHTEAMYKAGIVSFSLALGKPYIMKLRILQRQEVTLCLKQFLNKREKKQWGVAYDEM